MGVAVSERDGDVDGAGVLVRETDTDDVDDIDVDDVADTEIVGVGVTDGVTHRPYGVVSSTNSGLAQEAHVSAVLSKHVLQLTSHVTAARTTTHTHTHPRTRVTRLSDQFFPNKTRNKNIRIYNTKTA